MPIELQEKMANMIDLPSPKDMIISYYGLNHFGWWTKIEDKDGNDLMPQIKEHIAKNGFLDGIEKS